MEKKINKHTKKSAQKLKKQKDLLTIIQKKGDNRAIKKKELQYVHNPGKY